MGEEERNKLNILETDNKTYNLVNTDEAINFLIFALNSSHYSLFVDFVFSHCGINIFDYSTKFVKENKSKSIFEIQRDVTPFFNFFCEDYKEENVFYKYIYFSKESDLIKKQKINKIIDGLKKTLDFYFDFHNVSIFWNCEIDKNYDFIRKNSITLDFCTTYTYYSICKILFNFYDYLYDEFYIFIDSKNEFDYNYSNKIKEYLKNHLKTETKENFKNEKWFTVGKDFANGKIFDLIEKSITYRQIAIKLYNNESYRNFISESLSANPSNKSKNILGDKIKIEKIVNHFKENNLDIDERFYLKYKELNKN